MKLTPQEKSILRRTYKVRKCIFNSGIGERISFIQHIQELKYRSNIGTVRKASKKCRSILSRRAIRRFLQHYDICDVFLHISQYFCIMYIVVSVLICIHSVIGKYPFIN